MKKLIILALVALFAASSYASMLPADTAEVFVTGLVDLETGSDTLIDLNFGYGYFFIDYLETGWRVGIEDDDFHTAWSVGGFAEYNFDIGIELMPFVGASLDIISIDYHDEVADDLDETAGVLGLQAGAKYFITESLAVSTALVVEKSTEDIYAEDDGETSSTNIKLELGMRFFY